MPIDPPPSSPGNEGHGPGGSGPPPGAISSQPMNVPPIPLNGPPSKPTPPPMPAKKEEPKDTVRELIETIVFVVVLVLMLRTFLAEAFVIPTGSMAETLLGYHYKLRCEKCGKPNLVNASNEVDPDEDRPRVEVVNGWCENCGWEIRR